MNLTDLTLAEAAEGITNGRFSALELTEATLARIEKINPQLNAYIHVESEIARTEAAEIDANRNKGEILGSLSGVPLAHKDMYYRKGSLAT